MPYATQTPEQRKASNDRAYAKKLGITIEELEARRAAARGQNRKRMKKREPTWWQALQIKHAAYKGTRLEKSKKPPVPLILEDI